MNTYSFYNINTGIILNRQYSGPDEFLELNTPENHLPIPTILDYQSKRIDVFSPLVTEIVDDLSIIGYPPIIEYQPPEPEATEKYFWNWDITIKRWIKVPTFLAMQEAKWEEIKQIRSQKEFSPFTWDSSEFDADSESQRKIQGAAQLAMIATSANQSFSIDWTLADNTVRILSGADMISVGLALGTHVATQYEIARTLRTAIEATTTEEELNAITWPT